MNSVLIKIIWVWISQIYDRPTVIYEILPLWKEKKIYQAKSYTDRLFTTLWFSDYEKKETLQG